MQEGLDGSDADIPEDLPSSEARRKAAKALEEKKVQGKDQDEHEALDFLKNIEE